MFQGLDDCRRDALSRIAPPSAGIEREVARSGVSAPIPNLPTLRASLSPPGVCGSALGAFGSALGALLSTDGALLSVPGGMRPSPGMRITTADGLPAPAGRSLQ
ncbi:MAG: hypothetical protein LBF62_13285 [Tannerellaceae bacterium]|nr:hypothetical protein [Tannerellaceae bacterium]